MVEPFDTLCERLISHRVPLDSLQPRLLVRDYDKPFIIPCDLDMQQISDYNDSIRRRSDGFVDQIINQAANLAGRRPDITRVAIEVKHYKSEPYLKAFMVNGNRTLWNFYPISPFSFEGKRLWDYQGRGIRLIPMRGNAPTAVAIREWFGHIWHDGFCRAGRAEIWRRGMRMAANDTAVAK